MPPPDVWGPPIWTLFHVLAEKIKEEHFNIILPPLIGFIKKICAFLPCPDCAQHASQFLAKLPPQEISTKEKLKTTLYLFHNMVNVRKKKELYNYSNIAKYKYIPLSIAFNNFIRVYNTKGNMKLLTESFRRQLIIKEFKTWLLKNIMFFQM
jgi:hypothetical protein